MRRLIQHWRSLSGVRDNHTGIDTFARAVLAELTR